MRDPRRPIHIHSERTLSKIFKQRAVLKIILKVKNDHYFLERSIKHHEKIVGLNNLVIFDNQSSDPKMLDILASYRRDIPIYTFSGFYDYMHDTGMCPRVYEAINKGCDFFVFLDADEFLVMFKDDCYHCDHTIVELLSNTDIPVLPGTWLYNAPRSETIFTVGADMSKLENGLKWGKPIIRTSIRASGFINHNGQLEPRYYGKRIPTNIFILHMARLYPEQRIDSNLNKLRAQNCIVEDATAASVAEMTLETDDDPNIGVYISEIRSLIGEAVKQVVDPERLKEECIKLDAAGKIVYNSNAEADLLRRYLDLELGEARRIINPDAAAGWIT